MRVTKGGYRKVKSGERVIMPSRTHKFECCDCGLVHIIKFRMIGKNLSFRAWRDERATGQRRRWRKA